MKTLMSFYEDKKEKEKEHIEVRRKGRIVLT
jgi:hypothetical protein